jgi:hypothetical protein
VQGAETNENDLEVEKAIRQKHKFRWRGGDEIQWKKTVGGYGYGFIL